MISRDTARCLGLVVAVAVVAIQRGGRRKPGVGEESRRQDRGADNDGGRERCFPTGRFPPVDRIRTQPSPPDSTRNAVARTAPVCTSRKQTLPNPIPLPSAARSSFLGPAVLVRSRYVDMGFFKGKCTREKRVFTSAIRRSCHASNVAAQQFATDSPTYFWFSRLTRELGFLSAHHEPSTSRPLPPPPPPLQDMFVSKTF